MAVDTVARVSATVADSEGITSTVLSHIHMDAGQTVTQIKAAVSAWGHAIDQMTGAKITALRFELELQDVLDAANTAFGGDATTGIKTAFVADSEVQEVGSFSYSMTGIPYHWSQSIPALAEDLTAGGAIDITDGRVTALNTLLTGAVLGGRYTGMNTNVLSALYRAFRGDRTKRKQLFAKSVARA